MLVFEMPCGRFLGRVIQSDQLYLPSLTREVQQVGQLLGHTLDIRKAKIIALRREVESGQYYVKAEQIAEKIMTDHLIDLF
jgi:anti-sigma28 factor (negative regulator of flagellin synthesis)